MFTLFLVSITFSVTKNILLLLFQLPSSQYGVSTAHSPSHAIPLSNLSSSVTRSPSLPTSPSNAPQHDFSSLKRPTTTGPSHGPQLYGPPQAPRPPPPRYRLIDGTGSPLKNLTHREMEVGNRDGHCDLFVLSHTCNPMLESSQQPFLFSWSVV